MTGEEGFIDRGDAEIEQHTHTCVDCGAKWPCRETDWLGCTGDDGDGRCRTCANRAYDRIGRVP